MNERTCSMDGCDKPHAARDLCSNHYKKARRDGVITVNRYKDPISFESRLAYNVDYETSPSGCWLWTGTIAANGYGVFNNLSRRTYAHRASYEYHFEPIPSENHIDHLCHNADLSCDGWGSCVHRRCINPEHLESVSASENMKRSNDRMTTRGRKKGS